MREILFRGKIRNGGKWLEGFFNGEIVFDEKVCEVATIVQKGTGFQYPVDPDTIGQYTGLTDKNGKRIFEGDILKLARSVGQHGNLRGIYYRPLAVEYCDLWCQFVVADDANKEQFPICTAFDYFEVIGNIHDNPELLEDE